MRSTDAPHEDMNKDDLIEALRKLIKLQADEIATLRATLASAVKSVSVPTPLPDNWYGWIGEKQRRAVTGIRPASPQQEDNRERGYDLGDVD